jgi:hypothetical protein
VSLNRLGQFIRQRTPDSTKGMEFAKTPRPSAEEGATPINGEAEGEAVAEPLENAS